MFSQLRLHGGSNHLLLPTSLLQRLMIDAEPSNAFAGGVVRVESTDLEWVGSPKRRRVSSSHTHTASPTPALTHRRATSSFASHSAPPSLFPVQSQVGNTFAEHMTNRTRRVVREVAGVPAAYVWAAKSTSKARAVPPPSFLRHTTSALGLRHLLATAAQQKDSFELRCARRRTCSAVRSTCMRDDARVPALRYTRLHGAVGDEIWRTASAGEGYVVRGEGGRLRCAKLGETFGFESACDAREEALLALPEGVSAALAFLLVPQPNPIVPGLTDEMHCVTWG